MGPSSVGIPLASFVVAADSDVYLANPWDDEQSCKD